MWDFDRFFTFKEAIESEDWEYPREYSLVNPGPISLGLPGGSVFPFGEPFLDLSLSALVSLDTWKDARPVPV